MKKAIAPTLEEVKEYFKNAEWVECMFDKKPYNITEGEIVCDNLNRYEALFMDNSYCRLQKNGEYAKILTYKKSCGIETEPEYVITKEQIIELSNINTSRSILKEWFPEAFKEDEVELPKDFTGWCKTNRVGDELWLTYFESGELKYGFDSEGDWFMPPRTSKIYHGVSEKREATEQEVFEALTKEAVKRGFADGVAYLSPRNKHERIFKRGIKVEDGIVTDENSFIIFKEGKWAEIIPTISKEDAEKELGKKILN